MNETITKFFNDDKTVLTLPVPLGTTIYSVSLKCGDFCHWQSKNFHSKNTDGTLKCDVNSPCHTVKWHVYKNVFTLSNIEWVLNNYGQWIFDNKAEAESKAESVIKHNRKTMSNLGFMMTDSGYGLIEKADDI